MSNGFGGAISASRLRSMVSVLLFGLKIGGTFTICSDRNFPL
jgi:hypothetical protein